MNTTPNTLEVVNTTPNTSLSKSEVVDELKWLFFKPSQSEGTPKRVTIRIEGEENKCFEGEDLHALTHYMADWYATNMDGSEPKRICIDVDMYS